MAAFRVADVDAQSFRAELSSQKVAYGSTETVELRLKIRNVSSAELALLSWKLPFAGIEDDIFIVTCAGKRAPYLGRLYKRAAPTEADWVRIPAGKEVSGTFDLATAYAVDEGGECTVQFQFQLSNVNAKGADTLPGTVSSEPLFMILDARPRPKVPPMDGSLVVALDEVPAELTVEILDPLSPQDALALQPLELSPEEEAAADQPLTPSPEEEAAAAADFLLLSEATASAEAIDEAGEDSVDGALESLALTPTFRYCSATRQSAIKTALASAQTYARGAYSFLVSNPGSTSRYTRWFGRFTTTRHSYVKAAFYRMKNAMALKRFTFDCSCNRSGTFAYVYPSRPYQIWLCPVFWKVPNTGRDSRAGTIVHETSHFDIIGNTNDYVYGVTNARWLALYYPTYAIRNADNHEYFVELK